jgi:hypothetical protein
MRRLRHEFIPDADVAVVLVALLGGAHSGYLSVHGHRGDPLGVAPKLEDGR